MARKKSVQTGAKKQLRSKTMKKTRGGLLLPAVQKVSSVQKVREAASFAPRGWAVKDEQPQ